VAVAAGSLAVALTWTAALDTHAFERRSDDQSRARDAAPPAERIVSLVPSATEMLFAVGAGPRVVGVGSFDRYPPEAQTRVKVGGLLDPDVERILSLRPDLVVVYATQDDLRAQLTRAGLPLFLYRHAGLDGVTSTIRELGERVARTHEARDLAAAIERRLAGIRARVAGRPRPRTLLVFGREALALRNIFASGGVGFLHEMLDLAGGANVFADVARESVQASSEQVLARAPEVILEVRSRALVQEEADLARERATWSRLASVPAVRAGRVVLLVGDEFVVPGPRVAEATERLARALHPEAFR
jgi:iron complex transport system substrate-binding protein